MTCDDLNKWDTHTRARAANSLLAIDDLNDNDNDSALDPFR